MDEGNEIFHQNPTKWHVPNVAGISKAFHGSILFMCTTRCCIFLVGASFCFDGGIWDIIVFIPEQCLSIYFIRKE